MLMFMCSEQHIVLTQLNKKKPRHTVAEIEVLMKLINATN